MIHFSVQGLWDQQLALQWIKENISHFGGDSNNVTLCGYGSGSICASYHLFSSQSAGLFHRIILMSGTLASPAFWTTYNSINVAKKFAEELGITDDKPDIILEKLQMIKYSYNLVSCPIWYSIEY